MNIKIVKSGQFLDTNCDLTLLNNNKILCKLRKLHDHDESKH